MNGTRQVLMPFYDLRSGSEGWVCGLPNKEKPTNPTGLMLHRDGHITRRNTVFVPPSVENGTPPIPQWGWMPFDNNGAVVWGRVVAPRREQGSLPLKDLPERDGARRIYTLDGINKKHLTLFDINFQIVCEPDATGLIQLGPHELGTYTINDTGALLFIEPSQLAFSLDLWTCHLFRAFFICTDNVDISVRVSYT